MKSFCIGIALPAVLLFLAVPYLLGHDNRSPRLGRLLNSEQAFGWGLSFLGFAICSHAIGIEAYQNRPFVRYSLLALGSLAVITGFILETIH
jgi:hypothetical protein